MNVLSIFCTKIQVFFIRILPKIEFQNFHAFFSTESLFTFSTFQSSQVIQEVCLHILNKSLGLDRKNSFSSLAMLRRYVKLGGYMAWLVFFLNQLCDEDFSYFFTWLKQKQQKSYYFSMQNFTHNLTKIMPKSGL